MARLPEPGGDNGVWGFILNEFLEVEHLPDGRHHSASSSQRGVLYLRRDLGNSASQPNVVGLQGRDVAPDAPVEGNVLTWDNAQSRWEPRIIPAATNVISGIVRLTNDFGGTSTSPTVTGIQNRDISSTAPTDGQVLTWNNTATHWEPQTNSGGGSTTIPWLVAANDAPAEWKAVAGSVCDGTSDQAEINAVLATYGYCRLSPGTFNIDPAAGGGISLDGDKFIEGAGLDASILVDTSASNPGTPVSLIDIQAQNRISDLYAYSLFPNVAAISVAATANEWKVERVKAQYQGAGASYAIRADGANSMGSVNNCILDGISSFSGFQHSVTDNQVFSSATNQHGFALVGPIDDSVFSNNAIHVAQDSAGFYITAQVIDTVFDGNKINQSGAQTIQRAAFHFVGNIDVGTVTFNGNVCDSHTGILFAEGTSGGPLVYDISISGNSFLCSDGPSIDFQTDRSADGLSISSNRLSTTGTNACITFTNTASLTHQRISIGSNVIEGSGGSNGIVFDGAAMSTYQLDISGNSIAGFVQDVYLNGTSVEQIKINGNVGAGSCRVTATGAASVNDLSVVGNSFDDGIWIDQVFRNIVVSSNTVGTPISSAEACIDIDSSNNSGGGIVISGNSIYNPGTTKFGIQIEGLARGYSLSDNVILRCGAHGLRVIDSSNGTIKGNVYYPSVYPDGADDALILEGDSNGNIIEGNNFTPDSAGGNRYGINISVATCDDNIIIDNDLSPLADWDTIAINDAGTNTKVGSNSEWDLGLPAARTNNHVVTWNATNQAFELAAGGGGGGGGGGEPTIFVAASDAIPEEQAKADYVCTGTDDHVTINTALNDIFPSPNQGRLVLSAGSFYINPMEVDISDRVHLHGMGSERTFIRNQTDGASGQWLIRAQTDSEISNIGFITTSTYAGTVIASDYTRLENVTHLGGGAEIGIHITGAQQPMSDLVVNGAYTNAGILVDEGWVALSNVVSLRSDTAGGACIRFSSSAAQVSTISNCVISYNVSGAGDGIALDGGEIQINNVAIRTIGMSAIILEDTAPFQLSINNAHLEAAYGIRSTGPFPSIDEAIFSNLIIDATASGIDMSNVRRSKFHNITVVQPGEHGIRLTTSNDNTIDGCYVYRPGALLTNTYDGIVLEGDSNRNMITNSKVDPRPTGNTTRYGINIAAATCDDNIVVGNDLRPVATYGSGALNDAGTGTINTYPGGAAGDNFI